MDMNDAKKQAAEAALGLLKNGMSVGLGTGSTAYWFIQGLGEKIDRGDLSGIRAVPTSEASRKQAEELGIPIIDLPKNGLDIAVDGMDEVDAELNAVKGLGGALTREKIVAMAARQFVLIGDHTKEVDDLLTTVPLPVEVLQFGAERTQQLLSNLECRPVLRTNDDGTPFVTDNGNIIYDCHFEFAPDFESLDAFLDITPGVVEHGLFLGFANGAFIATPDGVKGIMAQ